MTFTSQRLSAELAVISQAVRSGQITRVEAEYLIQQRSELAAMQYEVFSALHDSLAFEVAQKAVAAAHPQNNIAVGLCSRGAGSVLAAMWLHKRAGRLDITIDQAKLAGLVLPASGTAVNCTLEIAIHQRNSSPRICGTVLERS